MVSLSTIIKLHLDIQKQVYGPKGIKVTSDLDSNMPDIYVDPTDNLDASQPIRTALAQLVIEIEDAEPTDALYQTRYGEGIQKIMLSHNGRKVPEEELSQINADLKAIAEGRKTHEGGRHGNLIAAQAIKEWGGRIYIENLVDEKYSVRTTIELPAKAP